MKSKHCEEGILESNILNSYAYSKATEPRVSRAKMKSSNKKQISHTSNRNKIKKNKREVQRPQKRQLTIVMVHK